MTDPLRAETERLLALAVDPPDGRWLCERMATHLHAIQAEADRLTAECEALREIVSEFERNAWDGDPLRRADDPLCIRARAAMNRERSQ